MDESILLHILILTVLLILSAFFSACEAAFFSLTSIQLKELKETKGRWGLVANNLIEKPRELLITIYIGNELVNISVSVITTSIFITTFGNIGVGIAIGVGTFLLLVFGEIIPKTLSLQFPQTYAVVAAYPLKLFASIVQPIQLLLTSLAEKFISFIGFTFSKDKKTAITDDEFRTMVQVGEGEGVIDSEESELIHNVIKFGETTAAEVMTPKIDMFTLSIDDKLEDILPRIIENFYARVPVLDNDGETFVGILFTKDLNKLKHLPPEKFSLKSVLRPFLSIPQTKKIKELLQEFKKRKRHMAAVLDEYGTISGLITLEDILEELVGEIDSEMRLEENPLTQVSTNNFRLLATYPVSEFNEYFGTQLPKEEFDTVGGFVFGLFGRIPRSGEAIAYENLKFMVEKMKGARILNLHLTVIYSVTNGNKEDVEEKK
ncbi:MAG: HlyC/CorC family transporter [Nitrospina sp.]|nr:HlyC/CorC family transporter [Nitrospina sp.]